MKRQITLLDSWAPSDGSGPSHAGPSTSASKRGPDMQNEEDDWPDDDPELLKAMVESARQYEIEQIYRSEDLTASTSGLVKADVHGPIASTSGLITAGDEVAVAPGDVETGIPCEDLPGFDVPAGHTWIYPTNYPKRNYQYDIVRAAIFKNTLVTLPTGLGKTFIAAVLIYNYYRWYPQSKVVFLAPTRPLVAQQTEACYNIMAIPMNDTVEITGKMNPRLREHVWREKRVFFMTPQIMMNDLTSEICPAHWVKLVVFDEAHKATGNHSYCEVIRLLSLQTNQFRVLALSATPGSDLQAMKQVVENLLIAHVELRVEESLDIQPYTFRRQIEVIVVPMSDELSQIQERYTEIVVSYAQRAKDHGLIYGDLRTLSRYQVLLAVNKLKDYPPPNMSAAAKGQMINALYSCITLYHGLDLMRVQSLKSFYDFMTVHAEKKVELQRHPELSKLMAELEKRFSGDHSDLDSGQASADVHPKMVKLCEIVQEHFKKHSANNTSSRVMIFCEYRNSVQEIAELLRRHDPLIKPMSFVGHGVAGVKSKKGFTQKEQLEVIQEFKSGKYNTLVSTCVGEEGLDIGEVDLIVCYDTQKSPVRMVQRMGRTGRNRAGRIIMLLTHGREEENYYRSLRGKNTVQRLITSDRLKSSLYRNNPRMIPLGLLPICLEMPMTVTKSYEEAKAKPKQRGSKPKVMNQPHDAPGYGTVAKMKSGRKRKIDEDKTWAAELTSEEMSEYHLRYAMPQGAEVKLNIPQRKELWHAGLADGMDGLRKMSLNSDVLSDPRYLMHSCYVDHSAKVLVLSKMLDVADGLDSVDGGGSCSGWDVAAYTSVGLGMEEDEDENMKHSVACPQTQEVMREKVPSNECDELLTQILRNNELSDEEFEPDNRFKKKEQKKEKNEKQREQKKQKEKVEEERDNYDQTGDHVTASPLDCLGLILSYARTSENESDSSSTGSFIPFPIPPELNSGTEFNFLDEINEVFLACVSYRSSVPVECGHPRDATLLEPEPLPLHDARNMFFSQPGTEAPWSPVEYDGVDVYPEWCEFMSSRRNSPSSVCLGETMDIQEQDMKTPEKKLANGSDQATPVMHHEFAMPLIPPDCERIVRSLTRDTSAEARNKCSIEDLPGPIRDALHVEVSLKPETLDASPIRKPTEPPESDLTPLDRFSSPTFRKFSTTKCSTPKARKKLHGSASINFLTPNLPSCSEAKSEKHEDHINKESNFYLLTPVTHLDSKVDKSVGQKANLSDSMYTISQLLDMVPSESPADDANETTVDDANEATVDECQVSSLKKGPTPSTEQVELKESFSGTCEDDENFLPCSQRYLHQLKVSQLEPDFQITGVLDSSTDSIFGCLDNTLASKTSAESPIVAKLVGKRKVKPLDCTIKSDDDENQREDKGRASKMHSSGDDSSTASSSGGVKGAKKIKIDKSGNCDGIDDASMKANNVTAIESDDDRDFKPPLSRWRQTFRPQTKKEKKMKKYGKSKVKTIFVQSQADVSRDGGASSDDSDGMSLSDLDESFIDDQVEEENEEVNELYLRALCSQQSKEHLSLPSEKGNHKPRCTVISDNESPDDYMQDSFCAPDDEVEYSDSGSSASLLDIAEKVLEQKKSGKTKKKAVKRIKTQCEVDKGKKKHKRIMLPSSSESDEDKYPANKSSKLEFCEGETTNDTPTRFTNECMESNDKNTCGVPNNTYIGSGKSDSPDRDTDSISRLFSTVPVDEPVVILVDQKQADSSPQLVAMLMESYEVEVHIGKLWLQAYIVGTKTGVGRLHMRDLRSWLQKGKFSNYARFLKFWFGRAFIIIENDEPSEEMNRWKQMAIDILQEAKVRFVFSGSEEETTLLLWRAAKYDIKDGFGMGDVINTCPDLLKTLQELTSFKFIHCFRAFRILQFFGSADAFYQSTVTVMASVLDLALPLAWKLHQIIQERNGCQGLSNS